MDHPTAKAPFVHHTILDYNKKDSLGQYPDQKWIDESFFHPKTRRIYTVRGFIWNSSTDEWNVHYSRPGCVVSFTKTIPEFKEKFVQVESERKRNDEDA